MKTLEQTAQFFKCSLIQLQNQYKANYRGLLKMYDKAKLSGKKINGYTEQQLSELVSKYKKLAKV